MSTHLIPTLAAMSDVTPAYYLAPVGGILALIMAKLFHGSVMKKSEGDENMVEIAQAVRDGAMAYQMQRAHKLSSIGSLRSNAFGIAPRLLASLTRPAEASTMSLPGSMPGMISVAINPLSVSWMTQRSVT